MSCWSMMGIDTILTQVVLVSFIALTVLLVMHMMRQPPFVAYIITGIIVGPSALGLIHGAEVIHILGEFGLVLFLFYIGMEINLPLLLRMWQRALFGMIGMIGFGMVVAVFFGTLFGLTISQMVLVGFILSLSSTAVVLRYLEERFLLRTQAGTYACGVLFAQDLAIVPMLVVLSTFGDVVSVETLSLQLFGAVLIVGIFLVLWKYRISAPRLLRHFLEDKEHALLFYSTAALGLAALSAVFNLSVAFGAFLAGLLVARHYTNTHTWYHLESIKTVLVAVFFMSIGVLVDIRFVFEHILVITLVVLLMLAVHTVVYAAIFYMLHISFRKSIYVGALLAQIGEFSFILALVGRELGIVSATAYQFIAVIVAVSLVMSPLWFRIFKRFEADNKVAPIPHQQHVFEQGVVYT